MRSVLIITQFTIGIVLLVTILTIKRQINFSKESNIGFNKDLVIQVTKQGELWDKFESFKNDLLQYPSISQVATASMKLPGNIGNYQSANSIKTNEAHDLYHVRVGRDFLSTIEVDYISEIDIDQISINDSSNYCVLNERACQVLDYSESDIGKFLVMGGKERDKIIGIVKDFHNRSMHDPIKPIVYWIRKDGGWNIFIKIAPSNIPNTIEAINKIWDKHIPDYQFVYQFTDLEFDKLYKAEEREASILSIFFYLSLFISSIGILGLASYTVQLRTKEIGIRKVHGASSIQILKMLLKKYIYEIGIGFIIACPIAYYAIEKWLENFAYKITQGWELYATAGIIVLCIAILAVSTQSYKASLKNPVEALRYE